MRRTPPLDKTRPARGFTMWQREFGFGTEENAMKLLAVDSNSILNRAYYGIRLLTTRNGEYTNGIFGFLNILFKILDEVRPDRVAFAFDVKAPTFRHERFEGYKAQRKGMPDELAAQLEPLKSILRMLGYPILELPGFEADDILGTLSLLCRERGDECVIATGDRDSFQLVGEGVTVRLASTRMGQSHAEVIDEAAIREKYGVSPAQMIDVKALMGDASDNIPGVAGIGEKTALDLIRKFSSLDGVYENLESPEIKKGVREKLRLGKEMAYESRVLAEIDKKVPLPASLDDLVPGERDNDGLYRLLDRLELRTTISRLGLAAPSGPPPEDAAAVPQEPAKRLPLAAGAEAAKAAAAILGGGEACLVCRYREDRLEAALLAGEDSAALLRAGDEGFDEAVRSLLAAAEKLVLPDSKLFYRFGYELGLKIPIVKFDPILAGYLISPLSSSYSVESLCSGRNIAPAVFAAAEELSEEDRALAATAALLPGLCAALRKEISENGQEKLLYEIEQPLSRVLASMEHLGFSVDGAGLSDYGEALSADIEELTGRIYFYAGGEFNINSTKQLGEVLFEKLGLPTKRKTRTKSGYSTDADVLESLRGKHPIIEDILAYRKLAKLRSTYVDGLRKVIGPDGRVHTSFRQTETRTGRISSIEPNLQNIPIRSERGAELRRFFVAAPGKKLVDADYSQIELRVLAHIADDPAMIGAFLENQDIHTRTAAEVFDLPEEFVTPQMRSSAKAVNFGIVYGIGAFSLSQDIGVTVAEADRYIKNYLATFAGVKNYMQDAIAFGKEHGYVRTMFGRRRQLPELSNSNRNIRNFGERAAMNTPIQGTAADIIKLAMVRVFDRLDAEGMESRLILQVHDELIVEAPADEAETAARIVVEEMQNAVMLKVPLLAGSGVGDNWLEAH